MNHGGHAPRRQRRFIVQRRNCRGARFVEDYRQADHRPDFSHRGGDFRTEDNRNTVMQRMMDYLPVLRPLSFINEKGPRTA